MDENKQSPIPEEEATVPEVSGAQFPGASPASELTNAEAVMLEKEEPSALYKLGEELPNPGSTTIPFPVESVDLSVANVTDKSDASHENSRQEWEKSIAGGRTEKNRNGAAPQRRKETPSEEKAAKPRKNRPAKADKAAFGDARPQLRDKVSQSKKALSAKKEPPAP